MAEVKSCDDPKIRWIPTNSLKNPHDGASGITVAKMGRKTSMNPKKTQKKQDGHTRVKQK